MYVPPISGSAIWVWKAVMPTNWTVLQQSVMWSLATWSEADLETEESRVVAIMIPKYPLVTWPIGNPQTTKVATVAMVKRAQKAHNQGLNTWLDC
jgi:hypothetical protein